jgi:hypothetical protein
MIQLTNERLKVEIAIPGTSYRGSRFDWSAFITQVTLDNQHTFCVPESLVKDYGSGGCGLCNEFGIFQPIGYKEAAVGEPFPKIGVGLLKKPDEMAYTFARNYQVEPFPLTFTESDDSVVFRFEPLPCRGYEVALTKTVRINSNRLRVEYELENVGSQTIVTHEYCHNFVAINEIYPNRDYVLHLAEGLYLEHKPPILNQRNGSVTWSRSTDHPIFCRTRDHLNFVTEGAIWSLWHTKLGVGMSESIDFPISRLGLWNAPHVVSPEVFVDITLKSGETMNWCREYRFKSVSDL